MIFKNKKKVFSLVFIVLSAMVMLLILFRNNELINLSKAIKVINIGYISIAVLFIFIFWLLEASMIYSLIIKFTDNTSTLKTFWIAFKTTIIGQYYSNITPLATGGQPVQLLVLKDEDIPLSSGTAILICKFLLFQVSVTIYSFCLVLYKAKFISAYYHGVSAFIFVGLAINMVMLSVVVLIAFNPIVLLKLCRSLYNLLHKLHIIKNVDSLMMKTENFVVEYKDSIGKLKEDYFFTIRMFAVTFIQLTVFFSITFFIYKALNLKGASAVEIICMQSFLYMAVSFIPTPGTA
ncbi:MAG: YbhN family protein, partial [Sedimentibacter sp.]